MAPLSLHSGALTAMLHDREVVTHSAPGRSAQKRVMAGAVTADPDDDCAREVRLRDTYVRLNLCICARHQGRPVGALGAGRPACQRQR